MFEYLISGIIGAVIGWLAATQPHRMYVYQTKYEAYRLIHDTAGQVFFYGILCIEKEDVYRKAFETAQYNLSIDLYQNEIIASEDVLRAGARLISFSIDDIKKDRKAYEKALIDIRDDIRKNLRIKAIHIIESLLFFPAQLPADVIELIEKRLKRLEQRGEK